jgi:hypothetical protein
VEGERDDLQTSTVAHDNHMHALTVQYYEIQHRCSVSIGLDALEPLWQSLGGRDQNLCGLSRWRGAHPAIRYEAFLVGRGFGSAELDQALNVARSNSVNTHRPVLHNAAERLLLRIQDAADDGYR